ncbi:MAG TPA: glycosyltransferase family 4 protein [Candidatus Melainabacteria bacterium]|nr:glycosyltransferase family 4 protein [Candidatus Melainabacteria bacterium]
MAAKRILMLSWEYPPRLIGGLGRVVCALSREMVAQGCEVHVITADHPGTEEYELDEGGVHVHRVKTQTGPDGVDWPTPNFITWDARLNFGILQYALKLHREQPFDIVHAHDWLVADAAWVLKSVGLPLVSTIHATEFGRNHGIFTDDSRYIDTVEWRLIYESRLVIVNSSHMFDEVVDHFIVPPEKIITIPNGVFPDKLQSTDEPGALRAKHGVGDGPVLLFVGRLVREKGIQVLLEAAPTILESHPGATIVIAGAGYYEGELRALTETKGLGERVKFFGLANDADLSELYTIADVLVVPSLYEPFGIVALEGMAARVPTVTSDAGGLKDIVEHTKDGITTFAGDPSSLAWGILQILDNPELAKSIKAAARQKVLDQFTWTKIAERTLDFYATALGQSPINAGAVLPFGSSEKSGNRQEPAA